MSDMSPRQFSTPTVTYLGGAHQGDQASGQAAAPKSGQRRVSSAAANR